MQSMSVNPVQLHEMSGTVHRAASGVNSALSDLDQSVSTLIGSWEGSAQDAYHTAQRTWNQKIAEMNQLLGDISRRTSEIGSGYTSTDARQAGNF